MEDVLGKIDQTSPAYTAVKNALEKNALVKGLIGVDRSSGKLVMFKVQ